MKLTLPVAMIALLLNGIACACPQMSSLEAEGGHQHTAQQHDGHQNAESDCGDDCECPDLDAPSVQSQLVLRSDSPWTIDEPDSGGAWVADLIHPATDPPAAFGVRTSSRHALIRTTPVSRFERMLD